MPRGRFPSRRFPSGRLRFSVKVDVWITVRVAQWVKLRVRVRVRV
jgi:hypothetical protein